MITAADHWLPRGESNAEDKFNILWDCDDHWDFISVGNTTENEVFFSMQITFPP